MYEFKKFLSIIKAHRQISGQGAASLSNNVENCLKFVKYLCKVNPQSLPTFQLTAGWEFGCSISVFFHYLIVKFILGNFRVNQHS